MIIGGICWAVCRKAAAPVSEEGEVIKIGITTALSGDYADYGLNILKGVKEAIEEINQNDYLSKKIELLAEDNQADAKNAVSNYQLFKSQNAKIVLSSFSGITGALNPLSKNDKIILMYNAMATSFADENEYAFQIYSDADRESDIAINWLKDKKEKLGVAYVMNPATELMVEKLEKKLDFSKHGFDIGETDFKTIILKLKNDDVDGIVIFGYSNQIINFAKQVVELKYAPKFIFSTSDGSRDDVILQVYSSLKENIQYIVAGYGLEHQDYVFGYDLIKTLAKGMKKCEDLNIKAGDPECLKENLKNVKVEGKSGIIDMNGTNKAVVLPKLFTITDGNLTLLEE
ncbi:ABC transporter substrate-binding protein [Patescibacteria group bacterium]|nr:ABC transporter substrate-binding protein [Patescibacteria group bacterium]MBU4600759.1 ABC transporter substrate-binding protein [Patescibacteria group bacterium]